MDVASYEDRSLRWADWAAWFLYISFSFLLYGGVMLIICAGDAAARYEIGR